MLDAEYAGAADPFGFSPRTYRDHLATHPFDAMNVAVARQVHIADTEAETAAARRRLAAGTERILGVTRDPNGLATGSHVLAYQPPGAADAHALYGTPDQIAEDLAALKHSGVVYVLLILETTVAQLRRFRDEVIPRLSSLTAR